MNHPTGSQLSLPQARLDPEASAVDFGRTVLEG